MEGRRGGRSPGRLESGNKNGHFYFRDGVAMLEEVERQWGGTLFRRYGWIDPEMLCNPPGRLLRSFSASPDARHQLRVEMLRRTARRLASFREEREDFMSANQGMYYTPRRSEEHRRRNWGSYSIAEEGDDSMLRNTVVTERFHDSRPRPVSWPGPRYHQEVESRSGRNRVVEQADLRHGDLRHRLNHRRGARERTDEERLRQQVRRSHRAVYFPRVQENTSEDEDEYEEVEVIRGRRSIDPYDFRIHPEDEAITDATSITATRASSAQFSESDGKLHPSETDIDNNSFGDPFDGACSGCGQHGEECQCSKEGSQGSEKGGENEMFNDLLHQTDPVSDTEMELGEAGEEMGETGQSLQTEPVVGRGEEQQDEAEEAFERALQEANAVELVEGEEGSQAATPPGNPDAEESMEVDDVINQINSIVNDGTNTTPSSSSNSLDDTDTLQERIEAEIRSPETPVPDTPATPEENFTAGVARASTSTPQPEDADLDRIRRILQSSTTLSSEEEVSPPRATEEERPEIVADTSEPEMEVVQNLAGLAGNREAIIDHLRYVRTPDQSHYLVRFNGFPTLLDLTVEATARLMAGVACDRVPCFCGDKFMDAEGHMRRKHAGEEWMEGEEWVLDQGYIVHIEGLRVKELDRDTGVRNRGSITLDTAPVQPRLPDLEWRHGEDWVLDQGNNLTGSESEPGPSRPPSPPASAATSAAAPAGLASNQPPPLPAPTSEREQIPTSRPRLRMADITEEGAVRPVILGTTRHGPPGEISSDNDSIVNVGSGESSNDDVDGAAEYLHNMDVSDVEDIQARLMAEMSNSDESNEEVQVIGVIENIQIVAEIAPIVDPGDPTNRPEVLGPGFDAQYYAYGGADVAPVHNEAAAAAAREEELAQFQQEQRADRLPSVNTIERHAEASIYEAGWVKDNVWTEKDMDEVVAGVDNKCNFCLGELVVGPETGGQPSIAVSIEEGPGWTSMRCRHACHYFCAAKWKAAKHSEVLHHSVISPHTHGLAIPCPAEAPCPVCREDLHILAVFQGNIFVPQEAMD